MPALAAEIPMDGSVDGRGGRPSVTTRVMAMTRTRQAIHPRMKATPFAVPLRLDSTRMKPAIGTGSSVTASPMRTSSATVTSPEQYGVDSRQT